MFPHRYFPARMDPPRYFPPAVEGGDSDTAIGTTFMSFVPVVDYVYPEEDKKKRKTYDKK